jgi:hypothetical protein
MAPPPASTTPAASDTTMPSPGADPTVDPAAGSSSDPPKSGGGFSGDSLNMPPPVMPDATAVGPPVDSPADNPVPDPVAAAMPSSAPVLNDAHSGKSYMSASTGHDNEANETPENTKPDDSAAAKDEPVPDAVARTDEPTTVMSSPLAASAPSDLDDIKQQALQQLTPLIGNLELTPEEKFRTTMMTLQATDDQSLIKEVYAAAQAIPDEKTRAQALLDVVNEINYFKHQSGGN